MAFGAMSKTFKMANLGRGRGKRSCCRPTAAGSSSRVDDEIGWIAPPRSRADGVPEPPGGHREDLPDRRRRPLLGARRSWAASSRTARSGCSVATRWWSTQVARKVFVEEVEQALLRHPDVVDVLVVGRPSPRFGQEVVAGRAARARGRGRWRGAARVQAPLSVARFKAPACVRVHRCDRPPPHRPSPTTSGPKPRRSTPVAPSSDATG